MSQCLKIGTVGKVKVKVEIVTLPLRYRSRIPDLRLNSSENARCRRENCVGNPAMDYCAFIEDSELLRIDLSYVPFRCIPSRIEAEDGTV